MSAKRRESQIAIYPLVLLSEAGQRLIVRTTPYLVGRDPENDLTLLDDGISSFHLEFHLEANGWWIVDAQSTNGTFVNAERIDAPRALREDDQIHFGDQQLQVSSASKGIAAPRTAELHGKDLNIQAALDLARVLANRLAYPHFQPLYDLPTREVIGWEALARAVTKSNTGPAPLLEAAATHNKAATLSDAFAAAATECAQCRHCWSAPSDKYLFLNTHPDQLKEPTTDLLGGANLAELSQNYRVVIEIPESLACKTDEMARAVDQIRAVGMLVAYDDFGKGQSRISDLLEVPPDFLKLDRDLITDLHLKPAKQTLIKAVVEACHTLEVVTIAEGIETEDELEACAAAGVDIGQGYLLSRPKPAYELFGADTAGLPQICPYVRLRLL